MSKLSFQVAVKDKEAAQKFRDERVPVVIDVAGEDYAAVKPPPGAFAMLNTLASQIRQLLANPDTEREALLGLTQFLNTAFKEADVREALIASGEYDDEDGDGDGELSDYGLQLARSNNRLALRWLDTNDDLGSETLSEVMVGLCEAWSAVPTGSPSVSSRGPKRTGAKSTGRRSPRASTSSKSTSSRRRASST